MCNNVVHFVFNCWCLEVSAIRPKKFSFLVNFFDKVFFLDNNLVVGSSYATSVSRDDTFDSSLCWFVDCQSVAEVPRRTNRFSKL